MGRVRHIMPFQNSVGARAEIAFIFVVYREDKHMTEVPITYQRQKFDLVKRGLLQVHIAGLGL